MQYLFTGIDSHLDFRFGVTGESYYNNAKFLSENKDKIQAFQLAEMPINFVYRHSIELFLKSLIIIFHKRLKINYGNNNFNSDDPEVCIDGKWKSLYRCHFIDKLYYYWLNELLLKNCEYLNQYAPNGDWSENLNVTNLLPLIVKYDRDSSFFRYPITSSASLDNQKYTMKKLELRSDQLSCVIDNKKRNINQFIVLLKNNDNEIVGGYERDNNTMIDVENALKKVAEYFYCIHIMTRVTLCDCN